MNSEAFIYFFLGIVASLIINLITPKIQEWLDKFGLVNKQKREAALKLELSQITKLYEDSSSLIAHITSDIFFLLGSISLVVILGILASFIQSLAVQIPEFGYYTFITYTATSKSDLNQLGVTLNQIALVILYLDLLFFGLLITFIVRMSNKIKKIRDFDKYKNEIEKRVGILEKIN